MATSVGTIILNDPAPPVDDKPLRVKHGKTSPGGGFLEVANAAARKALTGLIKYQLVFQDDTKVMYQVIDDTQLSVDAGWGTYPS
jgi:hypothetical protein